MRAKLAVISTVVLLLLISLGPMPAAPQVRVTIAVGPPSPTLSAFVVAGALAQVISKNIPNTTSIVQPIPFGPGGAIPDRMRPIAERRADLEIVGSVLVLDAFLGVEGFRGNPVPVRTLTPLWDLFYHLVTVEESGVRAVGDLRGKRVALDAPAERDALRFLRAAGIDPDRDVRRETLATGAWVAAMREKRFDAVFTVTSNALPLPEVLDFATTPGVRMRLVPMDDVLPALRREFGVRFIKVTVRKEFYPGMTADVTTVGATWLLVSHRDFNADLAYQITRLTYEKRDELAQAHKAAQYITLVGLAGRSPIPYHPGAARYLKERGVAVD